MLFNPRYGRVGFLGLGHMLVVDVLGPMMEVLGYILMPLFWLLGMPFYRISAGLHGAGVHLWRVASASCSLILEEVELRRFPRPRDLAMLTLAAVVENFGYRQINNFWRVKG